MKTYHMARCNNTICRQPMSKGEEENEFFLKKPRAAPKRRGRQLCPRPCSAARLPVPDLTVSP